MHKLNDIEEKTQNRQQIWQKWTHQETRKIYLNTKWTNSKRCKTIANSTSQQQIKLKTKINIELKYATQTDTLAIDVYA